VKTVLYLATSLNGKISLKNDDTPWSEAGWAHYKKNIEIAGNLVVGHKTYDLQREDGDFDSLTPQPFLVTVSTRDVEKRDQDTVAGSPVEALKLLEEKGFDTAIIGGGAGLASAFLEAKLIDELWLDLEPVVIGDGISMFEGMDLLRHFRLLEVKNIDEQFLHIRYEALRE
jgi:dihydrofolate reductase